MGGGGLGGPLCDLDNFFLEFGGEKVMKTEVVSWWCLLFCVALVIIIMIFQKKKKT